MRYVALLRGINVGGNTMIRMEELRKTFKALGFENVVSYINSGNLAFDARKSAEAKLVAKIEKSIENDFGKTIPVMVRARTDIDRILTANPFDGQFASHKEMHVLFLREEMPVEKQRQLLDAAPEKESFAIEGREIYCHLRNGVADSLLGKNFIENKLKTSVTARNWRTVQKLAEL